MDLKSQSEDVLRRRLDAIELQVGAIQARVGNLEAALAVRPPAPAAMDSRQVDVPRSSGPLIPCPHCGAGNPTDASACSLCRWRLPTQAPPATPSGPRPTAPRLAGMTAPMPLPKPTAPLSER